MEPLLVYCSYLTVVFAVYNIANLGLNYCGIVL